MLIGTQAESEKSPKSVCRFRENPTQAVVRQEGIFDPVIVASSGWEPRTPSMNSIVINKSEH